MSDLLAGLIAFEGRCTFMYQDSLGYITTGIGHLLRDRAAALALPWINELDGEPADASVIRASYAVIEAAPKGRRAGEYKHLTHIRLTDADVEAIAIARLSNEFMPGLRRLFAGFDDYPIAARTALVDMSYNLGVAGIGKFLRLRDACAAGNWTVAATECRRSTSRPERNNWTAEQFRLAAAQEAVTPGPVVG